MRERASHSPATLPPHTTHVSPPTLFSALPLSRHAHTRLVREPVNGGGDAAASRLARCPALRAVQGQKRSGPEDGLDLLLSGITAGTKELRPRGFGGWE